MACNRKGITNSIRKLITFHHSSGESIRNMAKLVNLPHSKVQYVIKRFKEKNQIKTRYEKVD